MITAVVKVFYDYFESIINVDLTHHSHTRVGVVVFIVRERRQFIMTMCCLLPTLQCMSIMININKNDNKMIKQLLSRSDQRHSITLPSTSFVHFIIINSLWILQQHQILTRIVNIYSLMYHPHRIQYLLNNRPLLFLTMKFPSAFHQQMHPLIWVGFVSLFRIAYFRNS